MKPQDLRIGDYVRTKYSKEIVQVCSISETKIEVRINDEDALSNTVCFDCSELTPVLIREVYDNLPYIKYLQWDDKAKSGTSYRYGGAYVEYLHQLQNIHYALTGNEIEIEI